MNRNHQDSFAAYPGYFGGGSAPASDDQEAKQGGSEREEQKQQPGDDRSGSREGGRVEGAPVKERGSRRKDGTSARLRFKSNLPKRRYLTALANSKRFGEKLELIPLSKSAWNVLFSPTTFFSTLRAEAASAVEEVLEYLAEKRRALDRLPGLSFWQQARLHERNSKAVALKTLREQSSTILETFTGPSTRRERPAQDSRATFERGKADFMIAMFSFQLLGIGAGAIVGIMPLSAREAVVGALLAAILAGITLVVLPRRDEVSSTTSTATAARVHA